MAHTRIHIIEEVKKKLKSGEYLCFQYCIYDYGNGNKEKAFRTIRRDKDGNLKPQRGQAGVPRIEDLEYLITKMKDKLIPTME
jgi:hypothetical protein